jgi:excisionase family DNA binding protein
MINTERMIPVTEAARRLNRSIEQVRRYLREGKLRGQRIGNQWFVDAESFETGPYSTRLRRAEAFKKARALQEALRAKYGSFDIAAAIASTRED